MTYDPAVHHRRSLRLHAYDYSQAGAYFVTICAHNRDPLLEGKAVRDVVQAAWEALPSRFLDVALDEFVLMPNHVHGIVLIDGSRTAEGGASPAPTLGRIVGAFKSVSAIAANRILDRPGRPFWQRNYYERVVRDEEEMNRVRQYIRDNPSNWREDPNNLANM